MVLEFSFQLYEREKGDFYQANKHHRNHEFYWNLKDYRLQEFETKITVMPYIDIFWYSNTAKSIVHFLSNQNKK